MSVVRTAAMMATVLALAACSEKPQTAATHKSDGQRHAKQPRAGHDFTPGLGCGGPPAGPPADPLPDPVAGLP